MKEIPEHTDILGNQLTAGDIVCYTDHNSMAVGSIVRLNPKMVRIKKIGKTWEVNKYPFDTVKVDGEMVTYYLLKNQK
jgi:hypothetical protein